MRSSSAMSSINTKVRSTFEVARHAAREAAQAACLALAVEALTHDPRARTVRLTETRKDTLNPVEWATGTGLPFAWPGESHRACGIPLGPTSSAETARLGLIQDATSWTLLVDGALANPTADEFIDPPTLANLRSVAASSTPDFDHGFFLHLGAGSMDWGEGPAELLVAGGLIEHRPERAQIVPLPQAISTAGFSGLWMDAGSWQEWAEPYESDDVPDLHLFAYCEDLPRAGVVARLRDWLECGLPSWGRVFDMATLSTTDWSETLGLFFRAGPAVGDQFVPTPGGILIDRDAPEALATDVRASGSRRRWLTH